MPTCARSRGYDKTTTTRALKKLEDAGYILRQRDPEDGRARIVQVSEEGERIRPAIEELSTGWAEILYDSFSESEKEMALELLRRMALNVSSYMETEEEGRGKPSPEIHPHESHI